MKHTLFLIISTLLFLVTIFCSSNGFTQNYLHYATLTGHNVKSISFSPDGQTLASGGSDGTIRLWNASTGTHKRTLIGHLIWVSSVSFSPDGQTLASGSWDYTIRLWDAVTGRHKQTLIGVVAVD